MKDGKLAVLGNGFAAWTEELQGYFSGELWWYNGAFLPEIEGLRCCLTESLAEALTDADAVLLCVEPEPIDPAVPAQFGVMIPAKGELGISGFFGSLQAVPQVLELVEGIACFAPCAPVINVSRPMNTTLRALYDMMPGCRAVGYDGAVHAACKRMAAMLQDRGIPADEKELSYHTAGIGGGAFLGQLAYRQLALRDVFLQEVSPIQSDLWQRMEFYPACGDAFLQELCPAGWFAGWEQEPTSVGDRGLAALLGALCGESGGVFSGYYPNIGQAPGWETGVIAASDLFCSPQGIRPLVGGELPRSLEALFRPQIGMLQTTMEAAVQMEREAAREAFLLEPSLRHLPREKVIALFDGLADQYLPDWE